MDGTGGAALPAAAARVNVGLLLPPAGSGGGDFDIDILFMIFLSRLVSFAVGRATSPTHDGVDGVARHALRQRKWGPRPFFTSYTYTKFTCLLTITLENFSCCTLTPVSECDDGWDDANYSLQTQQPIMHNQTVMTQKCSATAFEQCQTKYIYTDKSHCFS